MIKSDRNLFEQEQIKIRNLHEALIECHDMIDKY